MVLNPDSLRPRKRQRLSTFARVSWLLICLIGLSIALLFVLKFDVGRLRGAAHYVSQARTAVDAKDWPTALSAIHKVDGEARSSPEFLRILADYLIGTRTEPASLVAALEKLVGTIDARPEDEMWLALAYVAIGKPGLARGALNSTRRDQRETLLYQDSLVLLLKSEGRMGEAAAAERELFERFASNPVIAVRKASYELTGTFPEIREAALQRLIELAERADDNGLAAIRVLTSYPGLTASQARRLQHLAAKHSQVQPNDHLGLASVLLRRDPDQKEAILGTEINRFRANEGETLQILVAWLAREREFDKILELVPRDELRKSVELFPAVAQNLAQRQQWAELMTLLEDENKLPVSKARAAGWRALAARNLQPKDTRATRLHLEEAITQGLAKNDMDALVAAVSLAEEWNMLDLALDAILKLAVPGSAQEVPRLERCWALALQLKDEEKLAQISERLTQLNPANVVLKRRNDYLLLLRGEAIETAAMTPQAQNSRSSTDLLLEALKAYRLGNVGEAASTLGRIQNTTEMTSGQSAVYAGLLAKTRGEIERAYRVSESVRPELLLVNERLFWEMAR